MFAQRVRVTYGGGDTVEVTLTQWSISQWAQLCQNKGWSADLQNAGALAITMLRFQAYCELHRTSTGARPTFEVWDRTVDDVDPLEEQKPADPTQTATSDG